MLSFVRKTSLRVVFIGPRSERRGFLFHLSAGFSKSVDPLSGMSVDLNLVDRWLAEVGAHFSEAFDFSHVQSLQSGLFDWGQRIKIFLEEKAQENNALLSHLHFQEERGWSFAWSQSLPPQQMLFSVPHYLEVLPKEEKFDLVRVVLVWVCGPYCLLDFQVQGARLLKNVKFTDPHFLQQSLTPLIGTSLDESSHLHSIRLEYLGEKYIIELV